VVAVEVTVMSITLLLHEASELEYLTPRGLDEAWVAVPQTK